VRKKEKKVDVTEFYPSIFAGVIIKVIFHH